ncbi:hypothetical protein [Streptomyces sp. NPDC046862]|uniref:hypothetical protein n=1 Tax=Streptomyces sp. NPDC046862 TaxID=3154603 RepID=UPI003453DE84
MRRRACVLSAAALVGTVLGAAAPVAAGDSTAEVSPHTVAPGGTVTVTVTCDPTGGSPPDTIDAGSQAFEQGTVKLERVSGGEDSGSGHDSGTSREPGAGNDPAWGNDPSAGGDPATGDDPASGNDPATGDDPAAGYGPEAGSTPGTVPDSGTGPDPMAPDSGTLQSPETVPDTSVDPGSAGLPAPETVPAPAALRGRKAAFKDAAVLTAGFRTVSARGPVGVLTDAAPQARGTRPRPAGSLATAVREPAPGPRPAAVLAPAPGLAPAADPGTSSGLVYRGTARIAPAGHFEGGTDEAGEPSEAAVDGTCPAAPGAQGRQWSASFTVKPGGERQGKEAHGDHSRAPSAGPDEMRHGVQAGEGGAFTDSVPALVAGCLLIAGAIVAAVQRILVHRGLSKHR